MTINNTYNASFWNNSLETFELAQSNGTHNYTWVLQQSVMSPVGQDSYFGYAVNSYEDKIMVGAIGFRKSYFPWQ